MRRRNFQSSGEADAEIDMTPMLDVVFIMLIFFIVATSFVRESGIEVDRPSAQTAATQNKTAVMIAISHSDEYWLDRQPTDIRMVRPALERIKAAQSDVGVVVQADKLSSTGALVTLLDQLRLAGVKYTVATSRH